MRRGLKRLSSVLLIVTILLTTFQIQPLISYAVGGNASNEPHNSATGGGDTSITIGGGDWGNDVGRSGYRISIVDADDPTQVISIDKDGNPQVVDIILCTKDTFNYFCGPIDGSAPSIKFGRAVLAFSNSKTQSLQIFEEDGSNNIRQIFWPECTAELNETDPEQFNKLDGNRLSDELQWMAGGDKGVYSARGEELKQWLITDENGVVRSVYDSIIEVAKRYNVTLPDGTESKITETINKNTQPKKKAEEKRKTNNSSKADKNTTSNKRDEHDETIYHNLMYNVQTLHTSIVRDYSNNRGDGFRKYRSLHTMYQNSISLYYQKNIITSEEYNVLGYTLRENFIYMDSWYRQSGKSTKTASIASLLGIITAYAAETDTDKEIEDLIDKNDSKEDIITVVDTTITSRDKALKNHLGAILDLKEDGEYIFKTASTIDKPEANMKLATEKWRILVEPIDWFTPYDLSGTKPLLPYRFYGTVSNIADAMEVLGANKILNGANHLNRRTFNKVSWSALSVAPNAETDETMFNGKYFFKYYDKLGQKSNKELYQMNQPFTNAAGIPTKYGWGVQVYWVDNIDVDESTSDSLIRTWDDENYTDGTPGPAPDASSNEKYPPEESFKELSKKFNISKFYYFEYLKEDGGTIERLFDTQTRKDTPHSVVITHEGSLESKYYWKVVKWATGKEKIMPENGDVSRTYEEYCINNPGDYIGTDVSILELSPEDKDQVLYVKLVLTELPKKPTVVKVYETAGTTDKIDIEKNVEIPNNRYEIKTPDEEYNYIESTTDMIEYDEEPKSWNDVPKENGVSTETVLTIDDLTQVIYIRYEKVESLSEGKPIILHEDELAFPYSMDDLK